MAKVTSVDVQVETERTSALGGFDRQCNRGTLACDGTTEGVRSATSPPPVGAAGFDFSMTVDDAEKRCRAAGQMWTVMTRESFECSGSAGAKLPFHVDLVGCRGHLCRIVLSQNVASVARFVAVENELVEHHGPTRLHELDISSDCTSLAACIHDGHAKVRSAWKWDAAYTLTATLEAPTPGNAFVFVSYSSPTFAEVLHARGL